MTYSGKLVMPAGYVEVAEEEMMYLDGGFVVSKSKCKTLHSLCIHGAAISQITSIIAGCGGQAAITIVSGLIGLALNALAPVFAKGAKAKGLNITWSGYSVRR